MTGPDPDEAKRQIARVLTEARDPAIISAIATEEGELIVTLANGDSYDFATDDYWPAEK